GWLVAFTRALFLKQDIEGVKVRMLLIVSEQAFQPLIGQAQLMVAGHDVGRDQTAVGRRLVKNGSQVMTAKGFVSLYLGDLCPQHGDTCLGSLPAMRIWQAIGRFFGIVERRPCSRQGRWLLGKRGFGLFAMV